MAKKKNDTFTAEDVKRIWNSNSSSQKATETVTSTSPSYIQTSKETYTAEDVKKIWNSSQSTSTRQQTYTPQGHTNNRQQAYTPQTTTQSNRQQAYTPQSYKSYLAQKKNNEKKTTPNYSQTRPFNSAFESKLPDVPVKDFAENYKKTYSPQEVKTILRNYNAQNVLEKQQKNLNDAIQSGKITQEDLNAAFGNIDDLRNSIKDEHVNIYNEMKQTDPEAAREYINAPRNIMSEADERRADIYKKLKDLGIDADIAEAYYNDQDVATKNYENMTDAEKEQLKNEYESIQNYNVFERYLADGSIENKKEYNRKQELSNNYNKLKNDLTYDYLLKNGMSEDEMEALRQYYTYQSDSDRLAAEGYSNEEIEKVAQDRIDNYEATMAKIYDLFAGTDKFDDITQMIKERYANPQIERDAEEHAIEDSLFTLATNPLESTGAVLGNAYNFISGRPLQNYKTYTNIVRDTTSKNIDSRLGQIVYGGAMSIGDMAVAAAAAYGTGGGSIVSAGIQALEKAAEVINQGVDRGLTPEQIFAEGIGSGVTTFITEKIPMGKLSEIAEKGLTEYTAKEIGKTLASMMITEGAQEGFEDVADWAMDAVVSWDKNEFNEDVQAYIEQGYSKEEAVKKVIADRGIEMLTDVVIGGIGGGVMGGAGSTLAYTTGRIQPSPSIQTDIVLESDAALNQLIEAVQSIDTTNLSEEFAQRVEHAKEVSQKPSDELTVEDVVDMSNVVNEQAGPDNNLAQTIQEINYQANYENNINEYLTTGKIEEKANELPIERQAREQAQLAVKDFNKAALEQQKQAERNFINELKSYKKNDWQSDAEVKANTEQRLDEASAYFENDTAAKNFKDNYNGQSLDLYTEVSYLAYTAGESGQSFDTFLKNSAEANLMIKHGGVDKGYLKTLFYNGQNARTTDNEEVTLRKNENRGKATNLSPDDQLATLKKAIAKKLNIEVATNFEDAESRGNFMASVARLVTNSTSDNEYATIIHEMFEFARSYNAKGMELVDRTLTDMIVKKKGERSFVDAVNRYKETYRRAGKNAPEGSSLKSEANKTFSEAQEEFVNDAASYIFSTEEGMKNLIDYIMDDGSTTAQEKMSAIQTIKAWVDDLIRAIKNFLSGHPTDQLGYKYAERLKLTSAELQNISQMLVGALEGARENLAAMTEQEGGESEKVAHQITVNSTEEERYEILKDQSITVPMYKTSALTKNIENLREQSLKEAKTAIKKLARDLGIIREGYTTPDLDIEFNFSNKGVEESLSKQYNVQMEDNSVKFAKMLSCLPQIIENARLIEVHNDKYTGGKREDKTLKQMHVLISAFSDEELINPVKLEIKEFTDKANKLYVSIVMPAIEKALITEMESGNKSLDHVSKGLLSTYKLADILSIVKSNDAAESLGKYIPSQFAESGKTRNSLAVKEDSEGRELSEGQQEYFKNSVVRDDQGRLMVMYHGTPNGDFTVFRGGSYFTNMAWYADRYQNQGASSLGYKKTAKNPKTYAAYLNITKPFDTRDPEIRKIWDEQYYQKWDTGDITENGLPDWTAAEGLREFIEENGLDFDGIIIDEGGVPTDNGVLSRGLAWIPLNGENQVKDINNLNPTPNKDMRFSLDVPVEETDDLIAIHNMHEDELIKTLKLGGFPMPSIAITKAKMGHDDYGAISVLFRKDTIDPKNWENKVYSGDAYTPEFPQIDFKINENKASKIEGRIRDLIKDIPFVDKNLIAFDTENMEDLINRRRGDVVDAYSNKDAVKNAYLTDKGIRIETPMKEGVIDNYVPNDVMIKLADLIDDSETVNKHDFTYKQYEKLTQDGRIDKFIEILNDYEKKHFKNEKAYDRFHTKEISESRFDLMLKEISEYKRNGIKDQIDYLAVGELVNQKIQENKADYEEWIRDLFDGVIEKQGIRNNKEYISSSGNRRTWNQLHYDYTLDNIIRAMKEEPATGKGLGGYSFLGSATREFESIDDIKSQKDRLKLIDNEEYSKLEKAIADDLNKIAARISGKTDIGEFSAMQYIAEAVAKNKTAGGIKKFLSEWYKVTDNDVAEILALKQRVAELPTGYFEAKPQRAVGLDEVAAVVIPDLDTKLTRQMEQLLNENNIPVVKYKAGDKESRIKAVNSVEDIKFSLKVTDDSLSSLDADYEAAVKSGDIKKAKEYIRQAAEIAFPNSKARNKNGSLKEFYHGTYSEVFNEFDPKMLGTANDTGYFGKGFYFAFNEGEARMYGSNVIPAYLNTVNPFYVEDLYKWNGEKVRDFEGDLDNALFALNFKKTFPKLSKDIAFKIYDKEGNPINYDLSKFEKDLSDVLKNKKFVIEQNTEDGSDYVTIKADKTSENGYDWYEYEKDYAGKTVDKVLMAYDYLVETKYNDIFVSKPRDLIMDNEFSDAVKAMGHDSIFQGREGDEVVLFDSSQIKRSDITYDDNGNLIPLSERFKAENKDIRYSLKVTDTEGRELTKGQQKYFKNSKIVDENGRLKVMYHGSMFAGFTVFDPEASDDKISLFFSDNPEVSRTYTNTLKRFNPDSKWTFETLKDFVYSYSNKNAEAFEENGKIEIENYRTGHTKTFNSVAEAQKYFVDEYLTDSDNDTDRRGIYEVYLNAENPLIVDADGEYWNSLPPVEFPARHLYDVDIQQTSEGTEISYEEDGVVKRDSSANYKTKDGYIDIDAFYNKYGIDIDEQTKLAEHDYLYIDDIFLSKDGERVEEYGKTRDYTKYAKEHGYDSVIFKNIIDYGKYGRDADENVTSDVVVVFNSNQVKSIYNENPTKNEDIRYSIDVSDDGFFDSFLEIDEEVKKTESALKEMIDKRMDLDSDISKKMISDVASYIRNKYNSTYKKEWLESSITAIFKYLQNNNVRMEDIMYIMSDIAKPILENVKNADPEQEKLYKDIVNTVKSYKIKLDAGQKQEVINAYGSYKNFVDSMRGKITLSNDGIALDNIWTELVDKTGGSLSYGTVPNDQPIELANLINGLNPTYASLEGQALEDAAMDVALDIISQFYVHNSMTDAAKAVKGELTKRANKFKEEYKKRYNEALKQVEAEKALNIKRLADEIDNLTAEEQEAIRTGDTVNQVLIENLKKEYKARYERLQAQANEKIARARANYQNSWINKNLRRERSELKNRVLREVKALQNIIAHPQEGASKHVPINLIKPTIEMLEAINLDNGGRNKAIADRLKKMSEVYESFKNDDTYSFDYDERIASDIKELQEMFNNKSYADLGITELQRVIEIVTALKTQIKNANNLILQGKLQDAKAAADNAINEVKGSRRLDNAAMNALNRYGNIHLNAYREFRKLSGYQDGALMDIYNDLDEGSKREMQIQKDLGAIFQDVLEGQKNQKEVKKFISTKEEDLVDIGITDKNGKPIKITRAMRMSLIMHSMNAGNMRHVLGSGITIPNMYYFSKGKLDEAYAKGTNYRFVDYAQLLEAIQRNDQNKINELTTKAQERIEDMKKDLSEWEKNFLKDAEKMFHDETGKLINETSMKLKGYALARVKNYFPIKTDAHFTNQEWSGLVRDGSLEGMGMLKERVISTKPILLEDITNVIQRQIRNVSKYAGYAVPTRNFETIMKQTSRNQTDGQLHNLSETIDSVWGSSDTKYLKNLMQDIQGGRSEKGNFLMNLRGQFAGATLTLNPSVAIKQAASYPTAAAVVGWKALGRAVADVRKGFITQQGLEELEKINPLLWYRNQGNATQELADAKAVGFGKNLPLWMQKAVNWTQWFDTGTVRTLEYASMYYVDENYKNLKKGSEEYWQKVSEVFTNVVEQTQPNYSTLHKADIIRNPNSFVKMLVMFKTQPMQNFGIIYDAMGELNAAKISGNKQWVNEASSKAALAVTSQAVSATVFSAMTILSQLLLHRWWKYRDDDEKWSWEKFWLALGEGALSCLTGAFIGGSEIYEALKHIFTGSSYYGIEVSVAEMVNDFVENTRNLTKSAKDLWEAKTTENREKSAQKILKSSLNLGATIGEFEGTPVNNIKNMLSAMYFYATDIIRSIDNGELSISNDSNIATWDIKNQYERIYEALQNGDTEKYNKLVQELKDDAADGETSDEEIAAAVEKKVTDNILKLMKEDYLEGNVSEEELSSFLQEEKGKTEDEAYFQIRKWETGETSDYGPMRDLISTAAEDPSSENRKAMIEEINNLLEHGKDKSKIASDITKNYKDEYITLYNEGKAADLNSILRAALVAAGYTDEEAKKKLEGWLK